MASKGLTPIVAAAVLLALILGLCNVWLADLNQDEGWYLYAARLVAKGQLPYRDFAFTQAPMMPFVYLGALPFVEIWGVLGGRYFTMLLGLAGAGAAAWAASRLAPSEKGATALATFILIAVNCYNSQFNTVVKTYALCSLLLAGGILFSTWAGKRRGVPASVLAGVLLALAGGTRLSALVVLPIVFLWLVMKGRGKQGAREWLGFLFGAAATLSLVFIPFVLAAPENFWFFNVGYHANRSLGPLPLQILYKAGFLSRWASGYPVAFFLAAALLLHALGRRGKSDARRHRHLRTHASETGFLWVAGAAMSLIHLLTPFPYDDYQVAVFPLFAIPLGVGGVQLAFSAVRSRRLLILCLWGLLLVSAIAAVSTPINQDWFVLRRDLIWWRMKEQPDIVKLREVGQWLRDASGRRTGLITQDTYLAVESGLEIPKELIMGPFSYFPELSTERARQLNVCNREILERLLIESDSILAAFSEYGFAIRSPEIVPVADEDRAAFQLLLEENYKLVAEVPDFGQAHTRLLLYTRKSP